jgi:hypothetical protein
VLKAVTSENPSLRYLAGKDIETWIEGKRNMSDEEFYKMMKQTVPKYYFDLHSMTITIRCHVNRLFQPHSHLRNTPSEIINLQQLASYLSIEYP